MIDVWANSVTQFLQVFFKGSYKEKIWKYTLVRLLTLLALNSRMSLLIPAVLCLFFSLTLLLSTTEFPKVKFLEALGDSNMVDVDALKTLCFKVIHQLPECDCFLHVFVILKFCYEFDPLSTLV